MDPKPRFYPALAVSWPATTKTDSDAAAATEAHDANVERLLAEIDDCQVTAVDTDAATGATRFFFADAANRDRAATRIRTADAAARVEAVDVSDENWAERSQASITAVQVGRLTIAPPWDVPRGAPTVIVIQPSMGFGTAHHESTRLCLRLLQDVDVSGLSVLDVGTGSGVLAIAARRLGASMVVAADYDPDAIQSAQENLELNGLEDVALMVLDLADPSALGVRRFDVVFANLTGGLLRRYAATLVSRLTDGGVLIVSGVTAGEAADVVSAFSDAGLEMTSRLDEREWVGATFRSRARSS